MSSHLLWSIFWRRFRRSRLALLGLACLLFLALAFFLGEPLYCWITGCDPYTIDVLNRYDFPSSQHWLGTDDQGRDLLARLLLGGQYSVEVAFTSAFFSTLFGTFVGLVSGLYGGLWDYLLMRFVDYMLSIPWLIIYMVFGWLLFRIIGWGLWPLILVFSLFGWMNIARLVRGEVLLLRNSEYIEAARSVGATTWGIMFRHLLLNSIHIILPSSAILISQNLLAEATLSWMGMGIQEPQPSLGNLMMREVNPLFAPGYGPFQFFYPGITLILLILSVSWLGDGLRDALDPRMVFATISAKTRENFPLSSS